MARQQQHRVLYSRKEERKKARQEKKQRNAQFHQRHKANVAQEDNEAAVMEKLRQQHMERKKKQQEEIQKKREINQKRMKIREARTAIKQEDRVIKQMEKKLKLNKRRKKKNTLPKSFYAEGLGDILDLIDHRVKPDEDLENEKNENPELELDNDDEPVNSEEEFQIDDDDDTDDDNGDSEGDVIENDEGEDDEYADSDENSEDEDHDKIRKQLVEKEELDPDLLRKIRGQLNRVTSSNLPSISTFIENLYHSHSLYQVSQCICQVIDNLVIIPGILSPLKLVSELTLLVCSLHENVAEEVGGHAIHYFVSRFNSLLHEPRSNCEDSDDDKRVDNALAILVYFYAAGLIEVGLLSDIVNQLILVFDEKSIQLLLFVLVTVGFILRKDSPEKLKILIKDVQAKAHQVSSAEGSEFSSKRVDFMLETMTALKNNNILKVTQRSSGVYSPIERDELRNILKNCLKKSSKVSAIPATFNQALASNRWWIKVGTLLEQQEDHQEDKKKRKQNPQEEAMSTQEEKLCRALRLNTTALRRSLFRALISSTDYIEASDRLITLCPKNQVMEIANVVIQVAIHEKSFNLFYLHVSRRMSSIDRRYKLSFFYAIKDRVSQVEEMKENRRKVFGDLIFHFVKHRIVSLSILKGLDFASLSPPLVEFMKYILSKVMDEEESVMKEIFDRIPKKDHAFASSIRLFISCFMDDSADSKTRELLKAKIKMGKIKE